MMTRNARRIATAPVVQRTGDGSVKPGQTQNAGAGAATRAVDVGKPGQAQGAVDYFKPGQVKGLTLSKQ